MPILLTAVAIWALTGLIIAATLARHGHSLWPFALMGLVYGPFVLLVWLEGARGQQSKTIVLPSVGVVNETGWIDALIGLDGTPGSVESTRQVLTTLGPALHRIRLSSVVDHEVLNSPESFKTDDERLNYLRDAAISLGLPHAEIALVSGQADQALSAHAAEYHFDLLVVAHRRSSVASGLRGSTVGRLARSADIPVLIGPPA